jgi:hypothetical protein
VNRTSAVKYYGVGLFRALNEMRIPRNAFRGFNMGGLVTAIGSSMLPPLPGFADGGLVTAGAQGRPVVINLGGGQVLTATATDAEVRRLERAAVKSSLRSAGRKPTWYR